jgi:16S rRNA G1207 methylase RsmC
LEFGCGSGAIGLALSKYFSDKNISFMAEMIDIDQRAVELSMLNMKKNRLSQ